MVFKRENIPLTYLQKRLTLVVDSEQLLKDLDAKNIRFLSREDCETNPDYKQIIPYAIVSHGGKIACYLRSGSETRLHDKYSVGVGGHVEMQDYVPFDLKTTVKNALYRELCEEFADFDSGIESLHFLGVINEEITEVGHTHLGFVYLIHSKEKFNPNKELKNLQWLTPDDVKSKDLELWSKLALELIN